MNLDKYSTIQLKKWRNICLVIAIIGLVAMCFTIGIALYQISNDRDSILIFIVPIIFGPLSIIPAILGSVFGNETKKREEN